MALTTKSLIRRNHWIISCTVMSLSFVSFIAQPLRWKGFSVLFLSDSAQLKFRSFIHQARLASLDLVDVKSFLLFAAADENWFLCLGMVH